MPLGDDAILNLAEAWAALDHDPVTQRAIRQLVAARTIDELQRLWSAPLAFGTAGLRGPLQPGPSGLNRRTVRRATQGVAAWLQTQGADVIARGVVVGCDARRGSLDFYDEVLRVFAALGIPTHALPPQLPTPLVPFAVSHLGAAAGVMITASHNPPGDNGYKLYVGDGAQVNTPDDAFIADAMHQADELGVLPPCNPVPRRDDVVEAYRDYALALFTGSSSTLRVTYTPMHGVGGALFVDIATACGFTQLTPVASQMEPDGHFPTVSFPNPEEPGALDEALKTAHVENADIIIANDPDADRVALALNEHGTWRMLTGDEVGWLLGARAIREGIGGDGVVACSVVSSPLLGRMADAAGVDFVTTLTGFKWIARAGDGTNQHLAFGYEEALGYAVNSRIRDKDGITAALALLREADDAAREGRTLLDQLADIRAAFGDVRTGQVSIRAQGDDGLARLQARIAAIVTDPPAQLGTLAVLSSIDMQQGYAGLPPTTGVVLTLAQRGRVVIRPSGTEPKVKAYCEAEGLDALAGVMDAVRELLA